MNDWQRNMALLRLAIHLAFDPSSETQLTLDRLDTCIQELERERDEARAQICGEDCRIMVDMRDALAGTGWLERWGNVKGGVPNEER